MKGGVGSAVADAIAGERNIILKKLAVREIPRSGPPKVSIEKEVVDFCISFLI